VGHHTPTEQAMDFSMKGLLLLTRLSNSFSVVSVGSLTLGANEVLFLLKLLGLVNHDRFCL
jgi:hypothetical protein